MTMYGSPEERPVAIVRKPSVPSTLARELRSIADDCQMMGLATNCPGWHTVARGFLRCASVFETNGPADRASGPDRHAA
jgi:hypothetical protein